VSSVTHLAITALLGYDASSWVASVETSTSCNILRTLPAPGKHPPHSCCTCSCFHPALLPCGHDPRRTRASLGPLLEDRHAPVDGPAWWGTGALVSACSNNVVTRTIILLELTTIVFQLSSTSGKRAWAGAGILMSSCTCTVNQFVTHDTKTHFVFNCDV
jgi:hypothetical protein